MRDPLRDPRALDVLRWVEFGETVIATVLDVRGDVVRLSLVYSGQQQYDEVLLVDWPDWSGLDDVTVLRAADSPVPAAATDPWRPAEIAAAPWWRWCEGLRTLCGNRVHSVEGGVWALQKQRGANVWTEVKLRDPKPDPADPFLPWWLLQLLRERAGDQTVSARHMPYYSVWWVCGLADRPDESRVYGEGPTEIDALLSALQGVGS